eukprot:1987921-Lingulodinium_polyedra.AAC.1
MVCCATIQRLSTSTGISRVYAGPSAVFGLQAATEELHAPERWYTAANGGRGGPPLATFAS